MREPMAGSSDWDRARVLHEESRQRVMDQLTRTDLPVLGVADAGSFAPRICSCVGGSDGVQQVGVRYGELRDEAVALLDVTVTREQPEHSITAFLSESGKPVQGPEPISLHVDGDLVVVDLFRAGPFWAAEHGYLHCWVRLTARTWPTYGVRLVRLPVTVDLFPPPV